MIGDGTGAEAIAGIGRVLIMAAVFGVGTIPAPAQQPTEPNSQASVLDGVYSREQAELGRQQYAETCTSCHAPDEFTGAIFETWFGQPVGRFYSLIQSTMPEDNPGGLSGAQYAELVAYILELNGYPSGDRDLPQDRATLNQIRLEAPPNSPR